MKRQRKTYRYTQIVQSCWRNGVSTQKVLGNLGDLPEQTVDNLKLALRAAREGKALVVADDAPGLSDYSKVQANLRYLDLAVILQVWRFWVVVQFCQTPVSEPKMNNSTGLAQAELRQVSANLSFRTHNAATIGPRIEKKRTKTTKLLTPSGIARLRQVIEMIQEFALVQSDDDSRIGVDKLDHHRKSG